MNETVLVGRQILLEGFPWFTGKGQYPLPAYSEFMPPPRLGRSPYGETDLLIFPEEDLYGWNISEIEEEYELGPGLRHLGRQIVGALVRLGEGKSEYHIAGHKGRNLVDNPYWPPELAAHAGRIPHERYVVLLPLSLSRTQDDKGRVRWTFFGSSEQGPERAFWKSFYSAPDREIPERESLAFLFRILSDAYGETVQDASGLRRIGFRILPSESDPRFPTWRDETRPSWTRGLIVEDSSLPEDVRYILTFRPFGRLPTAVKERYFSGHLALLPFPGSLVFWGQPSYIRLQEQLPLAMQIPLQRLAARHDAPGGIRVPQSGWLHEPGSDHGSAEIHQDLLVNTYRRTSRWDRVHRHEADAALSVLEDRVARVLFSTASEALRLYSKPMARNCQIWTEDSRLLLDGPNAAPNQIADAARKVIQGGLFLYRFQFPAMRVGRHELYWHRPLAAYWSAEKAEAEMIPDAPLGFLTACRADSPDPARPVILWPRLLRREAILAALRDIDDRREYYKHQTALNIQTLYDAFRLWGSRPLPRSFARNLLRVAENEKLSGWLSELFQKIADPNKGDKLRQEIERFIEPPAKAEASGRGTSDVPSPALPEAITFEETATRPFEESFWNDIFVLSHGVYLNKDNADCVQEPQTLSRLIHHHRDLEALGDYLLGRHRRAVAAAGMDGRAVCGEMPFHWKTDFDYPLFGGWKNNQEGHTYERDLLVVIPGKNRGEAVVLADHYDTAYMEDVYEKERGGSGARLAAAGADDNHSATAAVLGAAPVFLKLSKEGRLERDIWLLHLTGEEFPADCLGARHFCRALVEAALKMRTGKAVFIDLSAVRIAGIYVMDMIAHNRDGERDVFQISPGKDARSLRLAWHAHLANRIWNAKAEEWNRCAERRGRGRGRRSPDGLKIPETALHPHLRGEVRTSDDPRSSLFNTDGQIFSDAGVPVVLFMENYDINRKGYHDTLDTMENIDLDYGAAVAAIAIEAAARAANSPSMPSGAAGRFSG